MKFNFRRLFDNLCAAGAAASLSALLIAGCATGEHVGKFWDKGDVKSSDAYADAEIRKPQTVAANDGHGPKTNGKIATVSGTQDIATGRASVADFPDFPPEPTVVSAASSPAAEALPGHIAVGDAHAATAAETGSSQTAGDAATGTILAPYVQKRAPSGVVDNDHHDDEIVKPKSVYAKQLDPFAATYAEPFFAPSGQPGRAQSPAPATKTASIVPPVAGATARPTPSAGKALADATSAPPVASPRTNTSDVMELVPDAQTSPPPTPQGAVDATVTDVFGPSAPPAPARPESTSAPVAIAVPAPTTVAPPKFSGSSLFSRDHSGVKLGDEELDEKQPGGRSADEKPSLARAATQVAQKAGPTPAATPYEPNISRPLADAFGCTAAPSLPVKARSAAPVPEAPKPPQDSWETTTLDEPTTAPNRQSASTGAAPLSDTVPAREPQPAAQEAPATPDAAPLAPIGQAATNASSALENSSTALEKLAAEPESAPVAKIQVEEPKSSSGSDAMICDSAAIHGRYTGHDVTPTASAPQNPFDVIRQKPPQVLRPVTPASPVPRSENKPNSVIDAKSTSCWDEAFNSPVSEHIVSTADFSVPAPPLPLKAGKRPTAPKAPSSEPASLQPAHDVGRSRSRAWFVVGMAAGLAMSAVVLRLRRFDIEPQAE